MSTHRYAHTIYALDRLAEALVEASNSLNDDDEERASERLRIVHDALRATEPALDWDTLALVLDPYVARLRPAADVDDAWPFNEHLDDFPDPEEDSPPHNLPFSFRKAD